MSEIERNIYRERYQENPVFFTELKKSINYIQRQ